MLKIVVTVLSNILKMNLQITVDIYFQNMSLAGSSGDAG